MKKIVIHWFRRDLRITDNHALSLALNSGFEVLPLFIFDEDILNQLDDKTDRRVDFIHQSLQNINQELKKYNTSIYSFFGTVNDAFKYLTNEYQIAEVFCNEDYEPNTIKRDENVKLFLESKNIKFTSIKDQIIFSKNDVLKTDQTPYTVYTPYSKKWKEKLNANYFQNYDCNVDHFFSHSAPLHTLEEIGFKKTDLHFEVPILNQKIISNYDEYRDYPSLDHTTHLGVHLRFGTISVRKCVEYALNHNQTWLNELIWREFFMQILAHFPKVTTKCFKEKYENIVWRNNEIEFTKWCNGETGYPIVDAGMRELNETGFMHNRVRMIVASFLCKHLLIDWRWGESYFAQKLLDYDLSANNGNWQWSAGCGCDSAPYFRIFNPYEQTKKFDKELIYINHWIPNLNDLDYPTPIVEHQFARQRALKTYKEGINNML